MSGITIRVLDGADRGRIYQNVGPPITIGREEGNTIQLNDERVSRYHIKIQEDNSRLVLTDLDSTNGTKVNGEDIQLRILKFGDMIAVGRSVLLFGSREQIAGRLARLRDDNGEAASAADQEQVQKAANFSSLDFELNWNEECDMQATLHALEPPELPDRLTPGQAAQLAEMLEFLYVRLRNLIQSATVDNKSSKISLDLRQWQGLIDLQGRLSEYLRRIGNPRD
ncbi:FHA domain-containing protein FhaA [Anatilimnocola aggregata]|uniref:FHA domain-containing protein FhaA n=1 Tax=Anatilimnocola aggregata TaxID=2528021 RepID=A0A517YMS7_9BACT|nr:FHA domain-containing protein [Anatilimnocola aggregata]QDU31525.1 FHA domain-containing protein FhaA [Anatilimnocola aggregata]